MGQQLTSTTGGWSGLPIAYAYQWQDCDGAGDNCASVLAAIDSRYTVSAADVGHTVRVIVTALTAGGVQSASSVATAVVSATPPPQAPPTNTAPPTISGTPQVGVRLTAQPGSWTNPPTRYGYQWRDCNSGGSACAQIANATSNTYALTAGDAGYEVDVVVTASNAAGSNAEASTPTAVVTLPPAGPQLFVAQSAAGSNDGSNCANAHAASWFDQSGSWGTAADQIGPGVTVWLCGAITQPLTAQGSGSNGDPITVHWEPEASISEPYCAPSGCFNTNDQSYLTLDGGSDGLIQATANGSGLANQQA
ncbi:MAG: hypothetical protein ACRET2_08605, partial [Steroidobacteraceae bacterium]